VEKPPQNAKITRKNASTTTRQTPSKTAQEAKQHSTQASTRPTEQRKETSYADIARKALKNSPTPIALPKSLQNTPKPPTTIKITLRNPLKETPKDLIDKIRTQEGDLVAMLIKAIRPLTSRHILIYPKDEKSRETLLKTYSWLASLQAEIYSRDYSVVVHGIDKALDPQEVLQKLQEQNTTLNLSIGSQAQWISKKPTKTGSIKISLKCPTQANRLIQQGLVLDYEIKGVYQYRPLKRCRRCQQTDHTQAKCTTSQKPRGKTFYKEKEIPISKTFQAGSIQPMDIQTMDIDDIPDSQDEWTLVEGTQKRRMAKPRGRPRLLQRKDSTQGDIQSFLVQSQTTQKSTQESTPTQNNVDTITIAETQ
jgi:ribosomal protein S15P/S13E